MIIGNHQPYLFPYIGYWQLMYHVNTFVIADNVQYIKKGYINRNSILVHGKRHMFTLEVMGVRLGIPINEVTVGNNAKKILKTISFNYKRAPYFEEIFQIIEQVLLNDERNLAKYVGYSIERIARYLDIDTHIIYESDLQRESATDAQAQIIDTCKHFKADRYINAIGGQALYDKDVFINEGITLNFLKTESIVYKQFNNEYVPNLSIIDIMMFNSKDEIKEMLEKYTLI